MQKKEKGPGDDEVVAADAPAPPEHDDAGHPLELSSLGRRRSTPSPAAAPDHVQEPSSSSRPDPRQQPVVPQLSPCTGANIIVASLSSAAAAADAAGVRVTSRRLDLASGISYRLSATRKSRDTFSG